MKKGGCASSGGERSRPPRIGDGPEHLRVHESIGMRRNTTCYGPAGYGRAESIKVLEQRGTGHGAGDGGGQVAGQRRTADRD